MSCFYCGKRVSLVRKRVDADFCCDEHREKYAARARRTIETLREADEQLAVSRKLNEGMPLPATGPKQGREPAQLMNRDLGTPLRFGWVPTGLPVSRGRLETYVPRADLCRFRGVVRNSPVPSVLPEKVRWSIGAVQEGPRPPRPFRITILLPEGGPKRAQVKQAVCDGPRRPRTSPPVELGSGASAITRRIGWRRRDRSIGVLTRAAKPPEPVKPPPASPPIVATLRHATMAVNLGTFKRPAEIPLRMPEPGLLGRLYTPHSAPARPPAPAYVLIERRTLTIIGTQVGSAGMPLSQGLRWADRFVPCPDGFRRRQFYSWEPLERFLGMGFETISGHRPEMRIVAAPDPARHVAVAHLWSTPLQDETTALPEPRRPAPPFPERLAIMDQVDPCIDAEVRFARPGMLRLRALDSRHHFPILQTWDAFTAFAPVRRLAAPFSKPRARWASGTAEAYGIPAWARPQTRGAKRIPSQSPISVRNPVFAGPAFAGGRRSAGPSPEKPIATPVHAPAVAQARRETIATARASLLLPELPVRERRQGQATILESACRAPVGRTSANIVVQPVREILLTALLPAGIVEMSEGGTLRELPPAQMGNVPVDIQKGAPQRLDRESLQRFRRRGYEPMRSRLRTPRWPAASTPGLVALSGHPPCPHPARQPDCEAAVVMFRGYDLPPTVPFHSACTVMDWTLLSPVRPGSADWGHLTHPALVELPLPLVLPVDLLGPIRDWGLAPPPEPEKPPEPIHEDFGAGLTNWLCAHNDWRQDIAGVRTGSLALLRPSLNMSDYELEFLGKIENRSIGWVFRAVNANHYYAAQIALDAAGAAHLARYVVLGGEREQPSIAPIDLPITKNASCRVKLSVCGNDFRLLVNDKPVSDWSDDRLPEGGVGFFSDGEDHARLYWVKVTPYYEAPAEEAYAPIAALGAEIHREIRMGV